MTISTLYEINTLKIHFEWQNMTWKEMESLVQSYIEQIGEVPSDVQFMIR